MSNEKPGTVVQTDPQKRVEMPKPTTVKVAVVLDKSVNFPDSGGSFKSFYGLYDTVRGVLIVEMKDGTTAELSIHSANVMGVKRLKQ